MNKLKLKDWEEKLKALFRIYHIPESLQLDWVLGSLEGEAKREVGILPEGECSSAKEVFIQLKELYGNRAPASVRSLFFNCRQKAEESVQGFALRLQECCQHMMIRDAQSIRNENALLRDQFLSGLREVSLRWELLAQVALNDTLTFAEVKKEAVMRVELEEEPSYRCALTEMATRSKPWEEDL